MDFLKNKWVQLVAWILWVIATIIIVLSGTSVPEVEKVLVMLGEIIAGVSAFILLIAGIIFNKKE